MMQGAMLVVTS